LLDGLEGKFTSSKWVRLAESSQDAAHRDIIGLVNRGILAKHDAGGIVLWNYLRFRPWRTGFAALPPACCFVAHRRTGTPGARRRAPFMLDRTSVR
jgi:hypothetical protein